MLGKIVVKSCVYDSSLRALKAGLSLWKKDSMRLLFTTEKFSAKKAHTRDIEQIPL